MKDAHGPDAAPARYQLADTEQEGTDSASHKALDGAAAAQGGPDIGRKDPDVRPLAADDAYARLRAGERLDLDRLDDHLAGRAHHLEARHGELLDGTLRQHATAHVVRVGGQPEADGREVLLVLIDEIGRELR